MNSYALAIPIIFVLLVSGVSFTLFSTPAESTYISVPPSGSQDPSFNNISLGLVSGYSTIDKFGKNPDVDTSVEDVWNDGGVRTELSSASTMIVTSSGSDTSGGSGANTVIIYGLDGNYDEITETVTLNAASPQTTTNSFIWINRMLVGESGSSDVNENDIAVTATTGGSSQAYILANEGQTQLAMYMIPNGYTGYLTKGFLSTDANQLITGELLVKPFDGSWNLKREVLISSGLHEIDLSGSGSIPEKSIIKWQVQGSQVNNYVTAGFKLILVETP